MSAAGSKQADCEYIVVGSGAGGGPVAANLAEAGHTVLLLEAGGDPVQSGGNHLPEEYEVPAFHALASENDAMKWDFYVRHYANTAQQERDRKFIPKHDGVLYPRAATLGGCTAHNAMIFVCPHDADWDHMAELTGDLSWKAENMRKYFRRMENCRYRPVRRWLQKLNLDRTDHGYNGWLSTEKAIPLAALRDRDLRRVLIKSAIAAMEDSPDFIERVRWFFRSLGDPNDWQIVKNNAFGIRYAPLTTLRHHRVGSRERVLNARERCPDKLTIELDALVTRVLFDDENRAVGVEYLKGKHLYRVHAKPSSDPGEKRQAFASREIILAGGAFNTPQILMLSGIGPREVLEDPAVRIPVRFDLPVGKNLQDRYEVGVVSRMKESWTALAGAQFRKGDVQYQQWLNQQGAYITNGGVLIVIKRSTVSKPLPDLFCLGLLAKFKGYFPGYSKLITSYPNYLSWIVLKGHTLNASGSVTLRSADPREPPYIDFDYFNKDCDPKEEDLNAVVDGIEFVRKMTANAGDYMAEEELPGKKYQTREELKEFVKNNAWGHHASCTCPMKPREDGGVVDSKFCVYGTRGLRIVDASVFPKIPGFFIVSSVYMIAEKASDVILADV